MKIPVEGVGGRWGVGEGEGRVDKGDEMRGDMMFKKRKIRRKGGGEDK